MLDRSRVRELSAFKGVVDLAIYQNRNCNSFDADTAWKQACKKASRSKAVEIVALTVMLGHFDGRYHREAVDWAHEVVSRITDLRGTNEDIEKTLRKNFPQVDDVRLVAHPCFVDALALVACKEAV